MAALIATVQERAAGAILSCGGAQVLVKRACEPAGGASSIAALSLLVRSMRAAGCASLTEEDRRECVEAIQSRFAKHEHAEARALAEEMAVLCGGSAAARESPPRRGGRGWASPDERERAWQERLRKAMQ